MKDLLEDLKRLRKKWKEDYQTALAVGSQRLQLFDALSKDGKSKDQRARGFLGKSIEYNHLGYLSGEVVILNMLSILANYVAILDIKMESINRRLVESGILQKAKDIGDISNLKREIRKTNTLLRKYYEEKKKTDREIEENRKKNIGQYVR